NGKPNGNSAPISAAGASAASSNAAWNGGAAKANSATSVQHESATGPNGAVALANVAPASNNAPANPVNKPGGKALVLFGAPLARSAAKASSVTSDQANGSNSGSWFANPATTVT